MRSTTRMMVVAGSAALALCAGGGIASAKPNTDAIVNSTCTYPQVIAAANAQDPATTAELTSSPLAVGWLQGFIAAPPGSQQRRNMAAQAAQFQQVQTYSGLINSVAAACKNY
jgi:hemophore-related protein